MVALPDPLPDKLRIIVLDNEYPLDLHLQEEGGHCEAHSGDSEVGYVSTSFSGTTVYECAECVYELISDGSYFVMESE